MEQAAETTKGVRPPATGDEGAILVGLALVIAVEVSVLAWLMR